MLCAHVQPRHLPHTTFPTPPGSATVLLATRGLLPAGRPRASGRWPALAAHPTPPAPPTSAGREGGSADKAPDVPPAGGLLLAPGAHPPYAARPPFHTEGRNPTGSRPHHGACG